MKPRRLLPVVLVLFLTGACSDGEPSQSQEGSTQVEAPATVPADPESEIPAGERLNYPAEEVQFLIPPPAIGLPDGVQVAFLENTPVVQRPFTVRLKFPAGTEFLPHTHPATSRITVISGTFNYAMGEKFDKSATTALKAGGSVIDVKEMPHFVWFDEETVVQLRAAGPFGIDYVNPADDPRQN